MTTTYEIVVSIVGEPTGTAEQFIVYLTASVIGIIFIMMFYGIMITLSNAIKR